MICEGGRHKCIAMIRVYNTRKLDTSNTPCKRRIGNKMLEISLLNCYLRQALSKRVSFTHHECRLSRWCLSNVASQWVKCFCEVAEKITFDTFSCHWCWELKTNKLKIPESQTFRSKKSRWKSFPMFTFPGVHTTNLGNSQHSLSSFNVQKTLSAFFHSCFIWT